MICTFQSSLTLLSTLKARLEDKKSSKSVNVAAAWCSKTFLICYWTSWQFCKLSSTYLVTPGLSTCGIKTYCSWPSLSSVLSSFTVLRKTESEALSKLFNCSEHCSCPGWAPQPLHTMLQIVCTAGIKYVKYKIIKYDTRWLHRVEWMNPTWIEEGGTLNRTVA